MNTLWSKITPRSVAFGLLVASMFYWLFSLPLTDPGNLFPTFMISMHEHFGLPLFFLIWFGWANIWAMPSNGKGLIYGVLLLFMLAVFPVNIIINTTDSLFSVFFSLIVCGFPCFTLGSILGGTGKKKQATA